MGILRRAWEASERGDWESAFRDVAPNYELDWSRALGLLTGVYRGEEAHRVLIDFVESWQSVRIEPHEFIEEGEHVVVPLTMHLVGRDGIGVQARNTWTVTIRDGMIVRACLYLDKQEALKAVGLREWAVSANLDLVRSLYADWERGDFTRADWVDPEIEFVVVEGPNAGTWHGVAGIADAMREFLQAWKGYRVEAEEYRELDRERILVLTLDSGRGKQSDVAMEQRRAHVYLIRGGKVLRITTYWDRDRAFADLGLEQ